MGEWIYIEDGKIRTRKIQFKYHCVKMVHLNLKEWTNCMYWHQKYQTPRKFKESYYLDKIALSVKVKHYSHSSYCLRTTILQWTDELFEIRYFADFKGYQENGSRLLMPPDVDYNDPNSNVLSTFANSISDAEHIAKSEMQKLAEYFGNLKQVLEVPCDLK